MRRPAFLAGLLALFATVVGATLGQRVFGGVPHAADGISYSFQGKIFAAGRPWLEPPPVPDAFKSQNILLDATRWCGIYPPGFPLLLAAGWLFGTPFLVIEGRIDNEKSGFPNIIAERFWPCPSPEGRVPVARTHKFA